MGKEAIKGIEIYGLIGIFAIASIPMAGGSAGGREIMVLLLLNLVTVIVAYQCFLKCMEERVIALIGSMLYTWMPYRMDVLYKKADVYEAVFICLLPLVVLGAYQLLQENAQNKKKDLAWILLVIGLSGMLQFYGYGVVMTLGLLLLIGIFYGKAVFSIRMLLSVTKVFVATIIINCLVLLPVCKELLTDRTAVYLAGMQPIQHKGGYLLHYVMAFFANGSSREFDEMRIQATAPLGMGFAVTCLIFVYLWMCFTGTYKELRQRERSFCFAQKLALAGAILMFASTKFFPWDALRSNRILQILTCRMQSPMELVPVVTLCFTFLGCAVLRLFWKHTAREVAIYSCMAVVGIALLTTMFLVGELVMTKEVLQTLTRAEGNIKALLVALTGCVLLGVYGVIASGKQHRKEDDYVEKVQSVEK